MEILEMIESLWFVAFFGLGGWFHYLFNRLENNLNEIKRETQENRERSLAAQGVVEKNTEAINKLAIIMAKMEAKMGS